MIILFSHQKIYKSSNNQHRRIIEDEDEEEESEADMFIPYNSIIII
jgi:hypothetical protein